MSNGRYKAKWSPAREKDYIRFVVWFAVKCTFVILATIAACMLVNHLGSDLFNMIEL
mgnify:CR=1 FL=1